MIDDEIRSVTSRVKWDRARCQHNHVMIELIAGFELRKACRMLPRASGPTACGPQAFWDRLPHPVNQKGS